MRDTRVQKVISDLLSNKARTTLVVLSIAVGVFAVGMTINAQRIMLRDLNESYAATNPAHVWLFISDFDDNMTKAVENMREVEEVEARRFSSGTVVLPNGREVTLNLQGIEDFNQRRVHRFESVEAGASVPGLREVLIERNSAQVMEVGIGDVIPIEMPDENIYEVTVVGIVHDLSSFPFVFSSQLDVYMTMETLQWMGEPDAFNQLNVVVAGDPNTQAQIVQAVNEIRDRTIEPAGYALNSYFVFEPNEHWANNETEAISLILSALGLMSIVLSAGLVTNTISAIISQQTQQIGIMRSVGALRGQVARLYLIGVLVYGALALLVSVPLGLVGAWAMANYVATLLNFDLTRINLPPGIFLLEVSIGLLVPLLAALAPILSGTGISVYDAIYQSAGRGAGRRGPIDRLLEVIRGLPRPMMMSLRNTFRKRARLALTLATLTLAGATFISVFSARASLNRTLDQMTGYWLFDVEVGLPGGTNIYQAQREAMRVAGVQLAEGWGVGSGVLIRADNSESEGLSIFGVPADSRTITPIVLQGRWLQPTDTRQVVINSDLLSVEPEAALGQEITLEINSTERLYEVVGVVSSTPGQGGGSPSVYMQYDHYTKVSNTQNIAGVLRVRLDPQQLRPQAEQDALETALEDRFDDVGLWDGSSQTQAQILADITANFDIILSFLIIMAALMAVVGGLGLAGTMSLNVLERTREIGVMRAVGASNGAVRQVVLAEGLFIGVLSWFAGAVVSFPLGYVLALAVGEAFLGIRLDFRFSVPGVLLWFVLVLIIAVLACLAPAQRASRLTVREVLAYE